MRLEPTTTIWRTLRGASHETWMFAVVVGVRAGGGQRLLDQDVLAGLEGLLADLVVGHRRRRDDDRVDVGIGEHLLELPPHRDVRVLLRERGAAQLLAL